jgi:hypothetical protein
VKSTKTAVALNFLIPGAGLWYLGLHWMALANFLVALTFPLIGLFWWSEHVHYLFLAIAAGSAGLAHAAAGHVQTKSGPGGAATAASRIDGTDRD